MYSVVLLAALTTPHLGDGGCACGSNGGYYGYGGYYRDGWIIGAGYACNSRGVAGGYGGYYGYYPYAGSPYHLVPAARAAGAELPPAKEVPRSDLPSAK